MLEQALLNGNLRAMVRLMSDRILVINPNSTEAVTKGIDAAMEPLRMIWYSRSVSVRAGATVMESPVCTPIGSTFSMAQTMMALSLRSRTTSISNSFQPSRLSSTRTCATGLASRPDRTIRS